MIPLSIGTEDMYAFVPMVYVNGSNSYFDFSIGQLTKSEQEAVDRVKDQMSEAELKKFIKGLRG